MARTVESSRACRRPRTIVSAPASPPPNGLDWLSPGTMSPTA